MIIITIICDRCESKREIILPSDDIQPIGGMFTAANKYWCEPCVDKIDEIIMEKEKEREGNEGL